MRIRRTALSALDVGIDIIDNGLLDSFWRNTSLESGTRSVTRARCSKFIQDVLIHVIIVSIHHWNNFVEVTENRVLTFDKNLWFGKTPSWSWRDFFRDIFPCSVEQGLIIKVAHRQWPVPLFLEAFGNSACWGLEIVNVQRVDELVTLPPNEYNGIEYWRNASTSIWIA